MGLSSSKGEDGSGVKSDTKDFVDRSIKEDKIVVFIKPTCPFCARIKKLFGDLGAPICIVDITKRQDTSAIQDYLQYKTGGRTVREPANVSTTSKYVLNGTTVTRAVNNSVTLSIIPRRHLCLCLLASYNV